MRALLLAILLVIVGLSAFILRRVTDGRTGEPLAPEVVVHEPAPVEPAPAPAVTVPEVRDGAELPQGAGTGAPAADVPIEDRAPGRVDDPELATRYADWTKERLEQRLAELESALLVEVDHVCDQRFDAGQFRVVDASEVEGLDDSYDVLSPLDAQGLLTRSRMVARELPGGDPEGEGEVEGSFEYQIVSLPPDAYPELYRKVRELEWLRARTAGEEPR
jgi:hypothetical protein